MDSQATLEAPSRSQTGLVDCWHRLPNKVFFFGLLAAWLALFHFVGSSTLGYVHSPSLFKWLYDAINADNPAFDDSIGNLIPLVVLGLFWWKRMELLSLPLKVWPAALLIVVFALIVHVLGFMVQQQRVSVIAMFIGIYGLTGLTWGRQWLRASVFPFFLFIFCIPLGTTAEPLTFPLRVLVSQLVEWIAHYILGIDVVRVGTQLFNPSGAYQYDVAPACSGIRSLIAIFLIAIIGGFLMFRSPWKRLLMVALALPFAVLGNLARMLLIIGAAGIGGQHWGNYVHESTLISLIPYIPAVLGIVLASRFLDRIKLQPHRQGGL